MLDNQTPPFEREEPFKSIWKEIEDSIKTNFTLFDDKSRLKITLKNIASTIDGDQFKIQSIQKTNAYLATHVEPLADQAATLLERGIKDRAEWDDLNIKKLLLWLELQEYYDLNKILEDEVAAHKLEIDKEQSQSESDAANALIDKYKLITKQLQDEEASKNIYKPGLLDRIRKIKHDYLMPNRGPNLSEPDVTDLVGWEVSVAQYSYLIQAELNNGSFDLITKRATGLEKRAEWEKQNEVFRLRRIIASRKFMDIKSFCASQIDGILNYDKRIQSLETRFKNDFIEAYAKLIKVEKGAKDIFKFTSNLPLPSNPLPVDFFDNCLNWVRELINWLNRFSRVDLNYVLPISLKKLLGTNYKTAMKAGKFNFELKSELFQGLDFLRLRGFSVYVFDPDKKELNGVFQAQVQAPSHYGIVFSKINIGRIATRDFQRTPDICGANTLFNSNPIGNWQIEFINPFSTEELNKEIGDLEDVYLDLYLAYKNS